MIRIRFSLVFIFLWIGLTACEHKDLCYDHPHFATVRVIFDWTKISNHDKPEGMRVVFYPTDDESNTWIFDFPGGEDGEVELPENDYRVICFNYDTDGMVWKENGSYTLFTADTRDVHLVLNFDYEVPSEPGSDGAGFDVDVDDWDDVNMDIVL